METSKNNAIDKNEKQQNPKFKLLNNQTQTQSGKEEKILTCQMGDAE
jgi:hypothetical protein